jgi:hypothetical protein
MFGSKKNTDKPMKIVVDTVLGLGSFAAGWQAVCAVGGGVLTVTVKRAKPAWQISIPLSDISSVEILPPDKTGAKRDRLRVIHRGGSFIVEQAAGLPVPFKTLCDALAAAVPIADEPAPQNTPDLSNPAALVGNAGVVVQTPERTESLVRVYDYTAVELFHPDELDFDRLIIGEHCELIQEPDNEYDDRAVYAEYNGYKFGYMYKGKLQDMVNDWLDRDAPFVAVIEQILPDAERERGRRGGRVNIHLGFYRETAE